MTKTLILVPTERELEKLQPLLHGIDAAELCGFGPIAAAARTSQLLATRRPLQVVLLGIAGSLSPSLNPGAAYLFDSVACYGVGIGAGSAFQSASEVGWKQWVGESNDASIGDSLQLGCSAPFQASGQLLTVCAAANGPEDVRLRRRAFPNAVAEDMEGFGVAVACRLQRMFP